ncbi:hypothetical protein PACTADRAFT_50499 [Pachysolen tannophilus NRRL Y-2460]|uniref:Suppressor of lethality of KEX2 GAS1 double null mutant protein 1 n=1 Tax=Pachysolen tannophilus NRRL Y-2460 TaxID=669874 RepID=A0A1E4TSA0_PACTA|nr:hypothetical protein PACTADRAFT_50499 [Pachysolen tannophilus NRRL Y-2460]
MGFNSTGLAVGLAIGIPSVVIITISLIFAYRSGRKFKREGREEGIENSKDFELDEISFNNGEDYPGYSKKMNEFVRSSTTGSTSSSPVGSGSGSGTKSDSGSVSAPASSVRPPVAPLNGSSDQLGRVNNYTVAKKRMNSDISLVKTIDHHSNRSSDDAQNKRSMSSNATDTNSRPNSNTHTNHQHQHANQHQQFPPHSQSHSHSQSYQNLKNPINRSNSQSLADYYDSVIPVLPPSAASHSHSASHNSNLNNNNQANGSNSGINSSGQIGSGNASLSSPVIANAGSITDESNSSSYNFLSRFRPKHDKLHKTHRIVKPQIISEPEIPDNESVSSSQNEYIKALNKNDSSSFPLTTHTRANASAHALNAFNNIPSYTSRSNSNSPLNGSNGSNGSNPALINGSNNNLQNKIYNKNGSHRSSDQGIETRNSIPVSSTNGSISTSNDSSKLRRSGTSRNMLNDILQKEDDISSQKNNTITSENVPVAKTKFEEPIAVPSAPLTPQESPFKDSMKMPPRVSQYINNDSFSSLPSSVGNRGTPELENVISNSGSKGIIVDEGYTNYDNNKKKFLKSVRPQF